MAVNVVDPDDVDRVVKLLADSGQAPTFAAAEQLLRRYRLQLAAGADACATPAWQAALLTAVNAGARAVHGGVSVALGRDARVTLPLGRGRWLSELLTGYGARLADTFDPAVPTIALGTTADAETVLHPFAGRWRVGMTPSTAPIAATASAKATKPSPGTAPAPPGTPRTAPGTATMAPAPATAPTTPTTPPSTLAATLAAAVAVSECFQRLRGNPVAADRTVALSLWAPDDPHAEGPAITELPDSAWLLGLGHLGMAYAWLLGLLPYPPAGDRPLVLQDDDRLSRANRATSMLHRGEALGIRKTRLLEHVLAPLGWDVRLVERRYRGGPLHGDGEPALLLAGVDNPYARRALDQTGFPVIVDAGLGAGPDGFTGMSVRRLPAARPSAQIFAGEPGPPTASSAPAYADLAARTGDQCGVERLAGRTVATAFVGVTAACWALGGVLRELHGGVRAELVDHDLRDPGTVETIAAADQLSPRITTVRAATP